MRTLLALLPLLAIVGGCATTSESDLDAEVRRLCAIDGGVTVYESISNHASAYRSGTIRIPSKELARPEDAYYYEWNTVYLKGGRAESGEADLVRSQIRLYRASDGKLLGESIGYTRRGGDIPGPWHPSHFTCSEDSGLTALLKGVFVPSSVGGGK